MICRNNRAAKRGGRPEKGKNGSERAPADGPLVRATAKAAVPPSRSVFRHGETMYHARCKSPLALQGIRAMLEADFYCFTCLSHVTIPLAALDLVPVVPETPAPEAPNLA
jgi:hypothetical protein